MHMMTRQVAFLVVLSLCALQHVKGSECHVSDQSLVGNGWCNYDLPGYNTKECMWDGGDCCADSCGADGVCSSLRDSEPQEGSASNPQCYTCGVNRFVCLDPAINDGYYIHEDQTFSDGQPHTFPYFASQATSLGNETFSTPGVVRSAALSIPGVFTRESPILNGEQQGVACASEWEIDFIGDEPVTLFQIQLYMDRLDESDPEEFSALLALTLEHSLGTTVTEFANIGFSESTNTLFPTFSAMTLKGARFTRLEIVDVTDRSSDHVCLNFLNIYTSDGAPDNAAAVVAVLVDASSIATPFAGSVALSLALAAALLAMP